ncbi:MAG TPA: tetratricopeptide repeat protein [Candidatus Dormibacteraeota bacterium]|nr:tetratricopeptide repeat protein [Candidatus Dormibacteraeota bacterium]
MSHYLFLLFFLCFGVNTWCASAANFAGIQVSAQEDAFQRGLAALKENRMEDALREFTAAERESPKNARIRNFRGILLGQMGKNIEAAAEYQEAIRLDPLLEDAYRNLGFLRWTEQQLTLAREALEQAVKLSPDDSFAHYYLGRVELDSQQYVQAFHELDISRHPLPAEPGFLIQAATGYVALGRQENARKSLEPLMNLPLSGAQSIQVTSLLLSLHENDSAISVMQKLSAGHSPTPATWVQFDLALACLLAGKYDQAAEQALVYAKALHPEGADSLAHEAEAWSLVGIAYAHMNQGEKSVNALRQATRLARSEEEHWLNLTRELMELKRYPECVTVAQAGLAANPTSYALHLRLGASYLAAGRYMEAESVFRDLVAAGDPLPMGYIGLAQVLFRTDRADAAATELADAQKKLGPNFLISYFRGLALARSAKPAEAMAAFQQAVQLEPNNTEAHLNLGKTQFSLGHLSDAIAEFQEALRLDPANVQAKRLLSQAYRRAGDATNAAKYAEASAEAPAAPAGDLIGDFFVPQWQVPSGGAEK